MVSGILKSCAELLKHKKLTLAFAESATAGRVMADFSLAPDAGNFLKGGIVCYDACVKHDLLKVPQNLIDNYSPESAEVTKAAANGLCDIINADLCVAITGLTRSGGSESAEKPVGTMFVHIVYTQKQIARRKVFSGSEEHVINGTVEYVAELIQETIRNY